MPDKQLYLGTALWGWSVKKNTAADLLSSFYEAGHHHVDTATNYPINKDPGCFRFSENVIADWLSNKNPKGMKIIVKIGSVSNDGGPTTDLSPAFIRRSAEYYRKLFGDALDSLWIHWDNRSDCGMIRDSINALVEILPGARIGLSGIKHPEFYREALTGTDLSLDIQIKHNLFTSDLPRYAPLWDRARFFAYGINAGGVGLTDSTDKEKRSIDIRRIDTSPYMERIEALRAIISESAGTDCELRDLNELALLNALSNNRIHGAIIGPSTLQQLASTLDFFKKISTPASMAKYSAAFTRLL